MKTYKFEDFAINCIEKKVPTKEEWKTYIGLEHMDTKSIFITRYGSDVPIIGEKLVMHKGDILFGKRNTYLRRAAIAPHDGVFSAHGMVLRPKTDIVDYDFFALFIASDYFFDKAIQISVGSLSPTVNWKDLKDIEFKLPDMDKQKEIAKVLWSINNTIYSYKEMLKQCDELVKGQFVEMFGDVDFNNIDTKIIDALDIRDDLRRPLNDGDRKDMKEGVLYPYYGATGKMDEINQYIIDGEALCIAEDCGSYGPGKQTSYIIKGKSWVNNHAHVLVCKQNCNIIYANNYLNIVDLGSYVSGTTRQKLTKSQLGKIKFLIPSIDLQNEFAEFYKHLDKSKFAIKEAIESLNKIYTNIINTNLG